MKRITKNKMEKKDIFAPLALGLGATRRAAVLLLVMMLTTATAWAQSGSCGDDLTWELNDNTLTISGTGAMADYSDPSKQPWKDYRSSIKTVVIGNGVTSIGMRAFYGCTSLTSINIPASVTSIGNYTFAYCTGLTSIEIPASVTSIGESAFWNSSNLATVTFAEDSQLATIGISAFSKCSGLTSIEIPASVTSIGDYAFHYCSGLATVSFAAGSQLTSIGNSAFEYCSGLIWIEIPASVTSIGRSAFASCSNLEAMTVDGGNAVYDSRNGCNAIIEKSSNTLIAGCKNTTIPDGVTSIRMRAFYGCTGLTSINIPAGVMSIGDYTFYGCTGLTSIDIPSSVTSIGTYTFYGCTGLTSIDIPASVTSIGMRAAFKNCSNLATVTVYAPSCSLGEDAFANCNHLANIYVFSNLVDNYKAAENWSTYADKITALPTVTTSYVDATGTLHEGVEAIPLNNVMTTLPAGTYVVNSDVAYTGTVTLSGDVHLILADGKTMNVTTSDDARCINAPSGQSLHIYGQTEGTGALNAQTQGDANAVIHIEGGTLGIHGGNVTATVGGTPDYLLAICVQRATAGDALVIDRGTLTVNGNNGDGIYIEGGDAHINGGQVEATGASAGITVVDYLVDELPTINPGILTLSGGTLTASGFYTYSGQSYAGESYEGTLAIAPGHTYTDGTSLYDSTTETATLAALGGKTLRPCLALADAADNSSLITAANGRTLAVTLQGRTLQTGSWNTFAVPFNATIPEGWTVKELTDATDDGSTLTLTFGDAASIEAGKPYLVEVASAVANPTFNDVTVSSTPAPSVFNNVISFVPTFGLTALPEGKENILFLATGNTLKHPSAEGQNLKGFRAYFQLPGGANHARAFRLDLGDKVTSIQNSKFFGERSGKADYIIHNYNGGATYNLSGQKVSDDYKGIVIKNGKKIVVH